MQKGQVEIVYISCDLSEKTNKEIHFLASQFETQIVKTAYSMQELGSSIGKKTGIIAITDEGLAQMTKQKFAL